RSVTTYFGLATELLRSGSGCRFGTVQILTVLSAPLLARRFPSWLNARPRTAPLCPTTARRNPPVLAFQRATTPSRPPLALVCPLPAFATQVTPLACAWDERIKRPFGVSHRIISPSPPPVRSALLSGLKARPSTLSKWYGSRWPSGP